MLIYMVKVAHRSSHSVSVLGSQRCHLSFMYFDVLFNAFCAKLSEIFDTLEILIHIPCVMKLSDLSHML